MALDDFKTNNSEDRKESIRDPENRIKHLITELDSKQDVIENTEHYNTKVRVSIDLAQLGYRVYINHEYDDMEGYADIYAELDDNEEGIGFDTIIVEIGRYTAGKAKNALKYCDTILLVPISSSIKDSVIINESDFITSVDSGISPELIEYIGGDVYINSAGEPFVPSINEIYTNHYKQLASDMLRNIGDVSAMSREELVRAVNQSSNQEYTTRDVVKVAEIIGFLK